MSTIANKVFAAMQKHSEKISDDQMKLKLDHYREEFFDELALKIWKYPLCTVVDNLSANIIEDLDITFGNSSLLAGCEHVIDVPNLEHMVEFENSLYKSLKNQTKELLRYISETTTGEGYVVFRC